MRRASGRLQRPHQLSLDPFCSDRSRRSGFSHVHFSSLLIHEDFAGRAGRCGGVPDAEENTRKSPLLGRLDRSHSSSTGVNACYVELQARPLIVEWMSSAVWSS